jgi:hypothetical protein
MEDFTEKKAFDLSVLKETTGHELLSNTFSDYAPRVFQRVRQRFGVSNHDFSVRCYSSTKS